MAASILMAALSYPVTSRAQQAPPSPPASAASAASSPQRVEVMGSRQSDIEERRQSTAAKIIVGRDEIERFGDSTLGEMLKRLPGVTIGGNPGRGGQIRMRGLGNGYTQILLDGERVQGGLSLDSIDPEMVERIEIQRAPTAETGARAIAGTINIITREGFRKRVNELKLAAALENGIVSPSASWTRDDKWGDVVYNLTVNTWSFRRDDESIVSTQSPTVDKIESSESTSRRQGLNANGRLQWTFDGGASLTLMPLLLFSSGGGDNHSNVDYKLPPLPGTSPYDHSAGDSDSSFALARLNAQWRHGLGDGGRMEWRGGIGESTSKSSSLRREFDADDGLVRRQDDKADSRERNGHMNAKYSLLVGEGNSLVAGAEYDGARRTETHTTLQDGLPLLEDFGDNLRASTTRMAAYGQDEWTLSSQWSAYAGLRWEGITTEGQGDDGHTDRNRSSVWTPLLHAVWKPEPKSRDQIRMSLTRSYRSPTLQNLMGRPTLSLQGNSPTSPDRAGNPALEPELATGVDLAYERYLPGGGMFSANVFRRRISDLMRTITTLETVPWSATQRWVARPENVGKAMTEGVELEARFRLNELMDDAPPLELRANVSLFRSKVDGVPAPNNRLDQQPGGTANLGADYRWPGTPLTVGGNFNYTPGYTTRLADTQWAIQSAKRVFDAYALWTINPTTRIRLTASNVLHQDADNVSIVDDETADTLAPTFVNWRVQLEMKL